MSGNVKIYSHFLKKAFTHNLFAKLKYLISKSVLKMFAKSLDHRNYNGAMFIGVNGIVVKSHGSMDRIGICNAIKIACTLSQEKINEKIAAELKESQALEFN